MSETANKFSPEVRDPAVRMVLEHKSQQAQMRRLVGRTG
jgi:hypothetical protein